MSGVFRALALAVLTLLAAEMGARALEPALPEANPWREPLIAAKVARMEALGEADVVLAGSSQMLFAGDPAMLQRDLGVPWTAYNAGLWGAPPVVNEHWLTQVVVPALRPSTVIYGVSVVDFVVSEADAAVATYFGSTAVRQGWLGWLDRVSSRQLELVRHRRSLRSPHTLADSTVRRLRGQDGPATGGAGIDDAGRLPRLDGMTFRADEAALDLIGGVVNRGWSPSKDQIAAFRRTIATLHEAGVEVLIADMAISQPMVELLGDKAWRSYRQFLREETAAVGATVLDLAAGAGDTRLFIDYDHVNRAGADVFNTVLARALGPGHAGYFHEVLDTPLAAAPLVQVLGEDVVQAAAPPDEDASEPEADGSVPLPSGLDVPVPSLPPVPAPVEEALP